VLLGVDDVRTALEQEARERGDDSRPVGAGDEEADGCGRQAAVVRRRSG
jgi:hypothetical protein